MARTTPERAPLTRLLHRSRGGRNGHLFGAKGQQHGRVLDGRHQRRAFILFVCDKLEMCGPNKLAGGRSTPKVCRPTSIGASWAEICKLDHRSADASIFLLIRPLISSAKFGGHP